MIESDRKYGQQEILGERWHEHNRNNNGKPRQCLTCEVEWTHRCKDANRTFTTPDDAYALEQALTNNAENLFAFECWFLGRGDCLSTYFSYPPEQRCQLIIDFYREKGISDE